MSSMIKGFAKRQEKIKKNPLPNFKMTREKKIFSLAINSIAYFLKKSIIFSTF